MPGMVCSTQAESRRADPLRDLPWARQFYNRQLVKGVIGLAGGLALSWLAGRAAPSDLRALNPPGAALLVPLCALRAVWLWSIIDAWRAAGC